MLPYHSILHMGIEQYLSVVHLEMLHRSFLDALSSKIAVVSCDKVHHTEKIETIDSKNLLGELKEHTIIYC